jgi:hypothetical protein
MVTNAGGIITGLSGSAPANTDVFSLSIDPNGGLTIAPSGFALPNLLFTVDNRGGNNPGTPNPSAAGIYTTAPNTTGGGAFAVLNGVTMDRPAAMGLNDLSFNSAFRSGPLDAMHVHAHTPNLDPVVDRPVHLDTFPTNGIVSDPAYSGRITCYASGLPPGTQAGVLIRLDMVASGGAVSRTSTAAVLPGYPDLYCDPFGLANQSCIIAPANSIFGTFCQTPLFQRYFNNPTACTMAPDPSQSLNPVLIFIDPTNGAQNGDLCFELDLSCVVPIGSPGLNPAPVLTVQILDFSTARLSSPLPLQLN